MKRILLIAFLCLAAWWKGGAQSQKAQLQLIGTTVGDSVVLRWAVANQPGWMPALISGFILERTALDSKNRVIGKPAQRMTNDTIHPWPYSTLERRINRRDTFALLAAQCLYGETMRTIQPGNDLIGALQQAGDEADNRYSYAIMAADFSAQAADLLGLRWVDRDIKQGNKYIYTLHCAAMNGQIWSDTALLVVKAEKTTPIQPMPAPVLIPAEKQIGVSWKKDAHFSGYFVERSEDGVHFTRLNKTPYMDWTPESRPVSDSLTWIDSVKVNYKPFYYRVSGVNPFAQVSPPSAVAEGYGVDRTPPVPPVSLSGENPQEGVVQLTWKLSAQTEPVQGLIVAVTTDPTLPFTWINHEMLPPTATGFKDEKAWKFGVNYYTVGIVDSAGNIAWTPEFPVAMRDFAPPVQPTGLHGSIDTSGVVQLAWSLGPDFDLKGYQVYYANQSDHVFIPLLDTILEDTSFRYKINLYNLTEHIYYKIKAFDRNLKESVFSETLELIKPDIIAPDAPTFDDYRVTGSSVYLRWRPASARDLQGQYLLRRVPGAAWERLAALPKEATTYTDTIIQSGQLWEYAVQSVDDAGLRSEPSFPVSVKIPPATKKPGFAQFRGYWDGEKKKVKLEWELAQPPCTRILIYRGFNDGGLEMFQSCDAAQTKFEDAKTAFPGTYAYALKPIYPDGTEGPLTEIISIHKP